MFEEDVVEEVAGEMVAEMVPVDGMVVPGCDAPAPELPAVEAPKKVFWGVEEAVKAIRKALKERSGKDWSVKHGRGTAYGWITIASPPRRKVDTFYMSPEDCAELATLLGKETVHYQGESVPASSDHRAEYVARAQGKTPEVYGVQYWD